jgi:L-threonylcarbamoyladenylate synthase
MKHKFTQAIYALQEGKLISFPSETVYALACDARNSEAVKKVFEAKGRSEEKRLAIMCASLNQAKTIGHFSNTALALATQHWPGALTLVVPVVQGHGLAPEVYQSGNSIAIRIPAHPMALALVEAFGAPVVATSANLSGEPPALTAGEVHAALGTKVACVLDGGAATIGQASTIIDTTVTPFRVVRQGSVVV